MLCDRFLLLLFPSLTPCLLLCDGRLLYVAPYRLLFLLLVLANALQSSITSFEELQILQILCVYLRVELILAASLLDVGATLSPLLEFSVQQCET